MSNRKTEQKARRRFWAKVSKSSGCWVWTGAKKPGTHPYGFFAYDGANRRAHRVSWQFANGRIPRGLCVLHRCDNAACVRPGHLFLGTNRDNTLDMVRKSRHVAAVKPEKIPRGEAKPAAKLTWVKVDALRQEYAHGGTPTALAQKYGVVARVIHEIVAFRAWRRFGEKPLPSRRVGKLTRRIAGMMRRRRVAGESVAVLAQEYGVSRSMVWQVATRRAWA